MTTYMDVNTAEVASVSADTLTTLATLTIPEKRAGRIKKVFVSYSNVVNAKGAGGYITVQRSLHGGPTNFIVGGGSGGATNTTPLMTAQEIPVDLEISNSEVVTIQIYLSEAAVDAHAGILWVA